MSGLNSRKGFHALLVSTSVVGLAAGGSLFAGSALAQGIEIEDTTVAGVLNGLGSSTDYILISNSTVTTDGVVNDGEIGDVTPNATGILVTGDSNVTGGVSNGGNLSAEEEGIVVDDGSTVSGGINNSGVINVGADVAEGDVDEALGIGVFGTDVDIVIDNSNEIDVAAADTGTPTDPNSAAVASGTGIQVVSEGNLDAVVNNSGTVSVSATATQDDSPNADAVGISTEFYNNAESASGNANSTVTNSSASTIDVSATALAESANLGVEAGAEAAGIRQVSEGALATNFSASNSGSILVESSATANANSADAFAFASSLGIQQQANGQAVGSALLTANNTGLIQVSAVASARTSEFGFPVSADAQAVGIAQDADLIGSTTSTVSNSGDISVSAEATGEGPDGGPDVEATAQGIRQVAEGGETSGLTANLSTTQSGNIDVSAVAMGEGQGNGDVAASAQGILQEANGVDSAVFSVDNAGNIDVSASADGAFSSPNSLHQAIQAQATGIGQESFTFVGPASMTVSSSGTISATANVGMDANIDTDRANAQAFGIRQTSSGTANIEVSANVTGDIDATAMSFAVVGAESQAQAFSRAAGVHQQGESYDGTIQFVATTDGNTNVTAVADAEGPSGADATAFATGISQNAVGDTQAGASASNTGTMIIDSSATADGGLFGPSEAHAFGAGIAQFRSDGGASGIGQGQFTGQGIINSSLSTIDVTVSASALGSGDGLAVAEGGGIFQDVSRATDAAANADNSGGISVEVGALASSTEDSVFSTADAFAQGISQSVFSSGGNASGNVSSGLLSSSAQASASAAGASSDAEAYANSVGLDQAITGQSAAAAGNVTTTISLDVSAIADASSSSAPYAEANAYGSRQLLSYDGSGTIGYVNSGNVSVLASASAENGFSNGAEARAIGAYFEALSDDPLTITANTSGNMTVAATASGDAENAYAAGLDLYAPSASGTLANHGDMTVHAAAPNGSADAYGIRVRSDDFTGTIGNYGTMTVTDEESEGGGTAYGLVLEGLGGEPAGSSATIENDGFLSAEVAISTFDAPGPSQINQLGGLILGDIWLSESYGDTADFYEGTIEGDTFGSGGDDVFNFRSGSGSGAPTATYVGQLDGLSEINVYPGRAYLDGGVSNTSSFSLMGDGHLTLSSNGPTQIDVTNYTQMSGSILAYEITPDPASAAQIEGTNVSLGGAVTVVPLAGFYPNSISYEEVVVSTGGDPGEWDSAIDTALLDVEPVYQGDDTVDLNVTRIPFNEVEGLNDNEQSVGDGLEEIYESSEGTPLGETLEELFTLDPEGYRELLASLAGTEHAQALQALLDSQGMFQNSVLGHLGHGSTGGGTQTAGLGSFDFVSTQMASAASDESGGGAPARQQVAAAEASGRAAGSVGIWGRAYGNFGDNDGDSNAPGFDQDQYGLAAGFDVAVAKDAVLGIAGGYSETDLDFDNGNEIEFDGFQVAAYGSYAPGAWYLDGMASYAWYDNDSRRATIGGTAKGDYDSEVFAAYGETGYGFELTPVTVTPFFGVGYVYAETDSFTESGAGGLNLSVDSNDAESLTTTLGVDVSARLWVDRELYFIPELRVGWEHEYLDDQQSIGAHFAGMPASSFTAVGSRVAEDSAVVGAGFTVEMGNTWQIFLDYDGKLNRDYSQHAVSGGVKLTW